MKLRLLFNPLSLFALAVLLGACTSSFGLVTTNAIDPAAGLGREDYLALRERTGEFPDEENDATNRAALPLPPIPAQALSHDTAPPASTLPVLDKKVSVSVSDSVPVRDLLLELVRKTEANVQIDPRVRGRVILTAHEQPFGQILKRICTLANLRFSVEDTFIHIEPDDPFQKSYRMDYLSLIRKASSDTSVSTNVFDIDVDGSSGNASTSSAENNSSAKISAVSEANFWSETEKSVAQILASGDDTKNPPSKFSINKQAGLITVYANQKKHDAVAKFLAELKRKASAQVLIDARIIEVELNETYQSGIDWGGIFSNTLGLAASFGVQPALGAAGFFTAGVSGSNLSGMINLVQNFGTTRVLSAPRITVLNNQTAVMKVATNQVYFVTQAQFTTTTNASGASITTNPVYTSTPRTVPVGLVMTVQPSIDLTTERITMTLRPTISRIVGEVNDPSIGLNAAVAGVSSPVQSQIPVLAVREMDSVIQLKSGEIAVMGGLMQDSSLNTDQGVPGLSDIAVVGNLFKSRDNNGKTSELVILLRATIADQPAPDPADRNLYHSYASDPRPVDRQRPPSIPPLPADALDDLMPNLTPLPLENDDHEED